MNSPKISVIVPVYKAEAYLHRCVDSLLAQTFQDFEVLLIDDGSPDRSGEICDEYAQKDSRIRVFHKENGGVSSARNLGLDNARGEWVTFVDSDDYVKPSYLFDFGQTECDADFYMQGYQKICVGGKSQEKHFSVSKVQVVPLGVAYFEGESKVIINYILGKLIKLDIVRKNDLYFDVSLSFGEDHLFFLAYLTYIQKIALSPAASYIYLCERDDSLSTRIVPLNDLFSYADKTYKFQMYIMQSHEESKDFIISAIQKRTYINIISTLRNLFLDKRNASLQTYRNIIKFYKNFRCGYNEVYFRQKCLLWIFYNLPAYFSFLIFSKYVHTRLR